MSLLRDIDSDLIEPARLAGSVEDEIRLRRRKDDGRVITPFEALKSLVFEAEFVSICAENLAFGSTLAQSDLARLRIAHSRITNIVREATKT